jgi:hypothetical protein
MDPQLMEGDSHLHFPENLLRQSIAEGQSPVMKIQEKSKDGDIVDFLLVPNRWGKLGKIVVPSDASLYRPQAREIVRVMMHNEYWEPRSY